MKISRDSIGAANEMQDRLALVPTTPSPADEFERRVLLITDGDPTITLQHTLDDAQTRHQQATDTFIANVYGIGRLSKVDEAVTESAAADAMMPQQPLPEPPKLLPSQVAAHVLTSLNLL